MNLLEEKWLPIRRKNGKVDWIAPYQIVEPDVIALAANRADFNGALAQLMIGLLQTTTPIDDESDWEDLFDTPPTAEVLKQWFEPVKEAFVLDGDGARFMQDFSLSFSNSEQPNTKEISLLFMEAPGESTQKENKDLFIKRGQIKSVCPYCAAAAIFTLHTNAPEGGKGNYTSLRSGGPLTTLIVATSSRNLWRDLWLNIQPQRFFLQHCGDKQKIEKRFTFPYLADINQIQSLGGETQPLQVYPHHVFWAMPRRIRLDFAELQAGNCDICKKDSTSLITQYYSRPYGLHYKGEWRHPFSPYYEDKKKGWFPFRPKSGSFSYKNWMNWVLGSSQDKKTVESARIINYAFEVGRIKLSELRLWAFGYEMDSMKAVCWYETTFPLYDLKSMDQASRKNLQELIKNITESSEKVLYYLREAIKEAWFPKINGKTDMRGDLSFIDKTFWDSTEFQFYDELKKLIDKANSESGIDMDDSSFIISLGETWLKIIADTVLKLFDADVVGAGSISQQNPRRIAEAYQSLTRKIQGNEMRTILRLPGLDKKEKAPKKVKV